METSKDYYNRYNLINSKTYEDVSENCLLYSVQNYFLNIMIGRDVSELHKNIDNYINLLYNNNSGMYNNIPFVTEGNDMYISHDQLTSICSFSAYNNLEHHKIIWKEMNFGTYDNIYGYFNIKRILHPRDYIYIGYLNNNIICKLLMPLLCIITIYSFLCTKKVRPTFFTRLKSGFKLPKNVMKKTDGQLLTLVRNFSLKGKSNIFNLTYKLCLFIARKTFTNGYRGIFEHYFVENEHPNIVLAQQINNYNIVEVR